MTTRSTRIDANLKVISLCIAVMLIAGCSSQRVMMPTPLLYGQGKAQAYSDLDQTLKTTVVDLLYITDRTPGIDEKGQLQYGIGRSPSLAFGTTTVHMGSDISWDELEQDARNINRQKKIVMSLGPINEIGRLPPTPYKFVVRDGQPEIDPEVNSELERQAEVFRHELAKKLAVTDRKEVYLFVHGIKNTFSDAAYTIAELWHYFGREGVPILYSWPAGHTGLLRGYTYDRESSEFTTQHLKIFLRFLTNMKEIEGIHLIAHSRGTDVTTSAIRELSIETRARGEDPMKRYRIKNLVLAAPDMDLGVMLQRSVSERLSFSTERLTIYTSQRDKAIGIASFLFGSVRRLGQVGARDSEDIIPEHVNEMMGMYHNVSLIEYTGTRTGNYGHNYFRTNPAVASDLVLTIRYGKDPGAENGRPLTPRGALFWEIDDDYGDKLSP